MRLVTVVFMLAAAAAAQDAPAPTVLFDFSGEPADGWRMSNVGLGEISVNDGETPSGGGALRVTVKKGKGSIRKPIDVKDWRTYEALSLWVKVEAHKPVELRIIAYKGKGPAGMLHRFTVQRGGWREIVLPLKDWREHVTGSTCDFSRIDNFMLRWDAGAGSVTIDDVRLIPGSRGTESCLPTAEDLLELGFPKARAKHYDSEHFRLLTNARPLQGAPAQKLLKRLEEGKAVLRDEFKVQGELGGRVPVYVFRARKEYVKFFERLGEHYKLGISPPTAGGYTALGVAVSTYDRKQGWERPVFVHEAVHGVVYRQLGISSNNWLQEALANAVQVRLYPAALDERDLRAGFRNLSKGRTKPFAPLAEVCARPKPTMDSYPQLYSFMAFLAARYPSRLPAVWDAVRALKKPVHEKGLEAIAGALRKDVPTLEKEWLQWGLERYGK